MGTKFHKSEIDHLEDGYRWRKYGQKAIKNSPFPRFAKRLTGIKENEKFQKKKDDQPPGLKHVVDEAKEHHNVKYVYVWHVLAAYWDGVNPTVSGMEHYDPALAYPIQSPGVKGNQPDIVMDSLFVHGLGLVHPTKVFNFYNELHAYLASCGIDGIKVDV